ncbi:putative cullin-like protein 2 [Papaver somniferum]|uniref:putative cullin-like protein 2 n=1 Tax=Papaver somniferum TaxID=3469 RepID=UPI000E702EE1|nr:putative cullin-like protein 2 [Papaver somniferum]
MELDQLEEGWATVQMGITKLINIIEGVPESPMDSETRMKMYTTVYNLGSPPSDYSEELYKRYEGVFNDYLSSKVLPAIQENRDDDVSMLEELVYRWDNHKDAGFGCFRKIVYEAMKVRVKDAVITLINQERDGEEIDQTLLMEVLEIFQNMECYVDGFETAFLDDTVDYYTKKVSNWTPGDYTVKAEECLKKEKDRVSQYLRYSTKEKLLKVVQDVLNTVSTVA